MLPVTDSRAQKWNIKRGLIRIWIVVTILWLVTAGGIWLSEWSDELKYSAKNLFASMTPTPSTDYEAICAKIRAQQAAGGTADEIPVIPEVDVVVERGIGRVVAQFGRCLAMLGKEAGVDQIPVALKIVGGDGSKLRELEAGGGKRFSTTDWQALLLNPAQQGLSESQREMIRSFAFVLCLPLLLLLLGTAVWWAARGFGSEQS